MANQAFALSPISARASVPSEEDYDAIREAFMETARGRWFLDEYAKRNRNADTRMVLDAVARIEDTLAAQKQPPPPLVADRLPAALTSIRSAVERAREAGFAAFDRVRLEENLAPIRKGTRIIKEISWRWREIGADGRICDLIDSQVAAIDTACVQLAETDPRVALRAAFEIIRAEVEAFRAGDDDVEAPPAEAVARRDEISVPPPAEAAVEVTPTEATVPASASAAIEVAAVPAEMDEAPAAREVETAFNEPEMPAEAATAEAEAAELTPDDADAQDEAVLDIVAFEMAAPDPDDADDLPVAEIEPMHVTPLPIAESEPVHVTTPPVVGPITSVARVPGPVFPWAAPQTTARQPSFQPSPPVAPERMVEASLGSTLIASGILKRPNAPANDPLAPIRRMSQAEKIAFFS